MNTFRVSMERDNDHLFLDRMGLLRNPNKNSNLGQFGVVNIEERKSEEDEEH